MRAVMILLGLALVGCETKVYKDGNLILKTQANAKSLVFRQGDTYLKIDGMNHSTPTRAGGSVLGTGLSGATGVATAILTKGLVR